MATKDVPLHGFIFCGLWGAWSMSVPELCRPTRQTAWYQIAKWSSPATHLFFRESSLPSHIHATRFVHMSQLVWCSKSQVTTFGHVTISFRNQRDDGNSNCSRADGAHESRSISGWTPFPFFAPGATSGTWRQDAVVLGRKADTTPPRKGPRDLSKNVFVMSTTKWKRNSLPT